MGPCSNECGFPCNLTTKLPKTISAKSSTFQMMTCCTNNHQICIDFHITNDDNGSYPNVLLSQIVGSLRVQIPHVPIKMVNNLIVWDTEDLEPQHKHDPYSISPIWYRQRAIYEWNINRNRHPN
eukprot:721800_1